MISAIRSKIVNRNKLTLDISQIRSLKLKRMRRADSLPLFAMAAIFLTCASYLPPSKKLKRGSMSVIFDSCPVSLFSCRRYKLLGALSIYQAKEILRAIAYIVQSCHLILLRSFLDNSDLTF